MKRLSGRLLVVVVAVLLLGESHVWADFMDWSYHWDMSPSPAVSSGTGVVTLALAGDGTSGSSVIPAANISTSSSAGGTVPPDVFNHVPYNLTLTLKDNPSGTSGTMSFAGNINGSLTSTGSNLTNTFSNPRTQQLTLGGHTYSVTIDPTLANLPAPGAQTTALLDALVSVQSATSGGGGGGGGGGPVGPPIQQVPEPSTYVLSGLALSLLVAAYGWKRRQAVLATA